VSAALVSSRRNLHYTALRVESERVSEFASMSDEELEAYVNGDRSLEH
jgi:hypothetical protein